MGNVVKGAAVVLKIEGGGEQYLYRGAPVAEGVYTDVSVDHAISVGLIGDEAKPDAKPAGK